MKSIATRLSTFATTALLMFPLGVQSQATPVVTTLYNFIGNGTDGVHPQASLVQGSDGNFYGTTASGGGSGYGTVFRVTSAGVLTTLHSFTYGADGADPEAALVQGSDGNFYGTTQSGGSSYYFGTVFQITPDGVLTTLHSFTETGTDGANPTAGLVQGLDGNFYGTTHNGGSSNFGTVFSITSSGEYTSMHSFSGSGMDGEYPDAGLVQGSDGNFYGTTVNGGGSSSAGGTVFQITPAGDYTTLHSFTSIGLDGQNPHAGLIQGSDGNFYGTTASGGNGDNINGTVYQITPTGVYHPLYGFNGTDGAQVYAGLIQGSDGNLYGTTEYGGSGNTGTAFQVTLSGVHTILHSFINTGTDGGYPNAGLIQGRDGSFYGTTPGGGSSGQGTIYKLTVPALPTVTLVATTPTVTAGSGNLGVFTLSLSAVQDHDVIVNITIKGSAINGSDYVLLKSTTKIKAGKTSKPITIIPLGEGAGPGVKRVVTLVLAPGDDYTVGTTGKVKIKISSQ